jgi:hypothetical protein
MAELLNSQRRIPISTYSPIQLEDTPQETERRRRAGRSWEKASYIRSLAIRSPELSGLRRRISETDVEATHRAELLTTLDLVARVLSDSSPASMSRVGADLGKVNPRLLVELGQLLVQSRRDQARKVETSLESMRARYAQQALRGSPLAVSTTPLRHQPARTFGSDTETEVASARLPDRPDPQQQATSIPLLQDAVEWAAVNDPQTFNELADLARSFSSVAPVYSRLSSPALVVGLLAKVADWGD